MTQTHDDYLGDGVYAGYDGYHIILDLRGQDNFTRIALEPQVLEALDRYRKRIDGLRNPETTPTCPDCGTEGAEYDKTEGHYICQGCGWKSFPLPNGDSQ